MGGSSSKYTEADVARALDVCARSLLNWNPYEDGQKNDAGEIVPRPIETLGAADVLMLAAVGVAHMNRSSVPPQFRREQLAGILFRIVVAMGSSELVALYPSPQSLELTVQIAYRVTNKVGCAAHVFLSDLKKMIRED